MKPPKEKLEAFFEAALGFESAGERSAYLARACPDPELRREVESLLEAHVHPDSVFADGHRDSVFTAQSERCQEKLGTVIGRYKLLQKIGEGGCGVVYMAEQEEPVRRRVALKIIKLGMDTKSVIARFEAERQALAMMDHPNIAKVHDAGATDTGRPYFVMELVRGVKITDYCDEKNLSTQQRLDLFVQVCHAVQHAHQKGIIHRDLKPSNILVNIVDGVPVPKVIDFGIAKATNDQRLTDKTVFTAFEQFIGTPAYMSPEQAEVSGVDVDTRSDIYSLGVLLYELLTGKTPFDAAELLKISLDAMRRTIREKEPERPSTRVSTLGADELTTTAKRRGIEPPKLANVLRGDLDWIVMKCLEKDRARRYETANGLAMDIQRHLSNEDVVACPPSRIYRFRKTVKRNKVAVAATTGIAAALLLGLFVATLALIRERAARQRALEAEKQEQLLRKQAQANLAKAEANEKDAKTEAERGFHIVQFFEKMLQGVSPSVASGRDTMLLREILDRSAADISADLTNEADVEVYLRFTIGQLYRELGELQKSEASFRRSVECARAALAAKEPRADFDLGVQLSQLGDALVDEGKHEEAEAVFRETLDIFRKLPDKKDRDFQVAAALDRLGLALRRQGKMTAAEHFVFEGLELRAETLGTNALPYARALNSSALLLKEEGKFGEAEAMLRKAFAIYESNPKEDDLFLRYNLAVTLERETKLAEAELLYRSCLDRVKKLTGAHPEVVLGLARNISIYFYGLRTVLLNQGKSEQAEASRRDAVASQKEVVASLTSRSERETVDLLSTRAEMLCRLGRWKEAAPDFIRACELRPTVFSSWGYLLPALIQCGEFDSYRNHCVRILGQFANCKDAKEAQTIALNCLILPSSGLDLVSVSNLANTACARDTNSGDYAWAQFTKALSEYRQAHFNSAMEWLQRVLPDALKPLSAVLAYHALPGDPSEREVAVYALLSLVNHQLHNDGGARAALNQAEKIADSKLGKPGEDDLSYVWPDWVVAQALLKEAQNLVSTVSARDENQSRTVKLGSD